MYSNNYSKSNSAWIPFWNTFSCMCTYPTCKCLLYKHVQCMHIDYVLLQSGSTALMIAAEYSDSDVIAALLKGGADCNLQNEVILATFMTTLQL